MMLNLITCELMKFYKVKATDKELFIEEIKNQIESKEVTFNNLKALRVLGILKEYNVKFKKNINNEYYTLFI